MERALSFDLSSDFAIFRRGYTTTSALTYAIPPKPTILGIIGAILGTDYNDYNTRLKDSKIAIRILSPIEKITIAQNLIDTSGSLKFPIIIPADKGRTRGSFEYLRNPRFRIFFSSEGESYAKLKSMLEKHQTFFTPYMGQANCIATIDNNKEVTVSSYTIDGSPASIDSVIPLDSFSLKDIVFEENRKYGRERVPLLMNADRVVEKYIDILYEVLGNSIKINKGSYQVISSSDGIENVVFF
ncbi:MAG: type I-B CRISPR-associated protein Cas5b [Candidatus Micrarchaeaceae archaeon]